MVVLSSQDLARLAIVRREREKAAAAKLAEAKAKEEEKTRRPEEFVQRVSTREQKKNKRKGK